MADDYTLVQDCVYCGGDGVITTSGSNDGVPFSVDRPCPSCAGTGTRALGVVTLDPSLQDLMDRINDVLEKVNEVKEVVDAL